MICSRIPSNLAFRSAFCKQILAFYHSQNVPNSRLFEMHTFINYAFSSSYKSRSKKHKMIKYAFFIPSDVTSYCLSLLLLRQIPCLFPISVSPTAPMRSQIAKYTAVRVSSCDTK
eukprot:1002386_1